AEPRRPHLLRGLLPADGRAGGGADPAGGGGALRRGSVAEEGARRLRRAAPARPRLRGQETERRQPAGEGGAALLRRRLGRVAFHRRELTALLQRPEAEAEALPEVGGQEVLLQHGLHLLREETLEDRWQRRRPPKGRAVHRRARVAGGDLVHREDVR